MVKLSQIKAHVTTVTIDAELFSEEFDVGVYLGQVTQSWLDKMGQMESEMIQLNRQVQEADGDEADELQERADELGQEFFAQWCSIIDWWEIEDDDGNQIPATREAARQLPIMLFRYIFRAVQTGVAEEGKS